MLVAFYHQGTMLSSFVNDALFIIISKFISRVYLIASIQLRAILRMMRINFWSGWNCSLVCWLWLCKCVRCVHFMPSFNWKWYISKLSIDYTFRCDNYCSLLCFPSPKYSFYFYSHSRIVKSSIYHSALCFVPSAYIIHEYNSTRRRKTEAIRKKNAACVAYGFVSKKKSNKL